MHPLPDVAGSGGAHADAAVAPAAASDAGEPPRHTGAAPENAEPRDSGAHAAVDGATPPSGRPPTPDAARADAPDGAGPPELALQVVRTLARRDGVVVERVAYRSSAGVVLGEICRPDDGLRHPVVLRNHGGVDGLGGDSNDGFCRTLAQRGYVVASASYRGEDGSAGKIEVCLGEVDDVRALMAALRAQPYVIPDRMAAWGMSHGGCITLALAQREPSLKAAVNFVGPVDWASLYQFWQAELAAGEPPPCPATERATCTAVHTQLSDLLTTATGALPAAAPAAYAARSAVGRFAGLAVPTMNIYGETDYLVDVSQACRLRSALQIAGLDPWSWYFDGTLTARNPPSVCAGGFRTEPPGTAWSQRHYLLVYAGQGHGFVEPALTHALGAALTFLLNRL